LGAGEGRLCRRRGRKKRGNGVPRPVKKKKKVLGNGIGKRAVPHEKGKGKGGLAPREEANL